MTRRRSLRSNLYRSARVLGDVEAAEKGPAAYARRLARKRAYRKTNHVLDRLLRRGGLR